jgi:(p)ppGpp synthase/HD superfamily hydrolase
MIDFALEVAAKAHHDQKRKGTDIPYITHPFAVAMILLRSSCPDEVIIAGLLHDTIEDANISLDYIRANFGEQVASIVAGCSEPDKSLPWEERKQHTIEYLRTAPMEVRMVTCADKLHNIRMIASDYERLGDELWGRFKRGRREQEWYYRGIVESLFCGISAEEQPVIFKELQNEIDIVFRENKRSAIWQTI